MSAKKNTRLGWYSQKLAAGESDARIVDEGVVLFRLSEKTIKRELREVYERWAALDRENQPFHKAKFMELGMAILAECREKVMLGPAVQQFKTLAQIAGVLTEKVAIADANPSSQPAPEAGTVRQRISSLSKDPKIRERALKLGLDLDALEVLEPELP